MFKYHLIDCLYFDTDQELFPLKVSDACTFMDELDKIKSSYAKGDLSLF